MTESNKMIKGYILNEITIKKPYRYAFDTTPRIGTKYNNDNNMIKPICRYAKCVISSFLSAIFDLIYFISISYTNNIINLKTYIKLLGGTIKNAFSLSERIGIPVRLSAITVTEKCRYGHLYRYRIGMAKSYDERL